MPHQLLIRRRRASDFGLHSHYSEVIRGYVVHPDNPAPAFAVHALHLKLHLARNVIEDFARLMPYLHEVGIGKAVPPAQVLVGQEVGKLFRLVRVHGAKHQGIHHAEDGGVDSDSQRKRQYACHRESRAPPQAARSVAQIIPEGFQPEAGARSRTRSFTCAMPPVCTCVCLIASLREKPCDILRWTCSSRKEFNSASRSRSTFPRRNRFLMRLRNSASIEASVRLHRP